MLILVADDEPAMRMLVRVNLEFAGFGVDLAENGLQAIQKAEAGGHDLLLLDVMMPDLSGHEVARRLRRLAGAPPIVFLSARASREDRRQGYALGAFDYIEKPFDPLEIGGRVQRVLDRVREGTAETVRLERLAELGG